MNISEFLEARIAEDEAQAEACQKLGWGIAQKYGITAVSHTRVLAECAAKRAIIEGTIPERDPQAGKPDYDPLWAVRSLAAVYKDHPDYQQEWAL